MSGDVNERSHLHFEWLLTFESQPGGSADQQHPFVRVLIVPKAVRAGVAVRDDALDAETWLLKNRLEQFVCQRGWNVIEEIFRLGHSMSPYIAPALHVAD